MELEICYFGSWETKFRCSMKNFLWTWNISTRGRVDEKFYSSFALTELLSGSLQWKIEQKVCCYDRQIRFCLQYNLSLSSSRIYANCAELRINLSKLSSLPHHLGEASARSSATLKNVYLIENSNINKSLSKKTMKSLVFCFVFRRKHSRFCGAWDSKAVNVGKL